MAVITDDTSRARKHRERAAELRLAAQDMMDPANIKAALSVADNYEQLAKRIESFISVREADNQRDHRDQNSDKP